jgi:hypothetical protein
MPPPPPAPPRAALIHGLIALLLHGGQTIRLCSDRSRRADPPTPAVAPTPLPSATPRPRADSTLLFRVPLALAGEPAPGDAPPVVLACDPDGSFWIGTAQPRLLHFAPDGTLLGQVDLDRTVSRVRSLQRRNGEFWVLDGVEQATAVVRLAGDGHVLARYPVPPNLARGLFNVGLEGDQAVIVQRTADPPNVQLLDSAGHLAPESRDYYLHAGRYFVGYPHDGAGRGNGGSFAFNLAPGSPGHLGPLTYVFVEDDLTNVQFVPAATPAYFYVLLDQVYRGSPFINPIVYQYRADGSFVGAARVPLTGPHNRVTPQLAIGGAGSIYAARVQPEDIEIRQLRVFADPAQLPPVLAPLPAALSEWVAQSDAIVEAEAGPLERINIAGAGEWVTQELEIRRWWKSADPARTTIRLIPALQSQWVGRTGISGPVLVFLRVVDMQAGWYTLTGRHLGAFSIVNGRLEDPSVLRSGLTPTPDANVGPYQGWSVAQMEAALTAALGTAPAAATPALPAGTDGTPVPPTDVPPNAAPADSPIPVSPATPLHAPPPAATAPVPATGTADSSLTATAPATEPAGSPAPAAQETTTPAQP